MKPKKYIYVPTLFTALNLFSGFLAIVQAADGKFANAGWLIFIASFFDALDGRIARAMGGGSDFGLQMDSLGDVVSAGLAPAILVYEFYLYKLGQIGLVLSFLPLLFAAFRLARYNLFAIESGKKDYFIGMPAPMAAVSLSSCIILFEVTHWSFLLRLIVILVPVVSLLMASNLTYESFPRFNVRVGGKNRVKLFVFWVMLLLLVLAPHYTLFAFMMCYLLSGPVATIIAFFKANPKQESEFGKNL